MFGDTFMSGVHACGDQKSTLDKCPLEPAILVFEAEPGVHELKLSWLSSKPPTAPGLSLPNPGIRDAHHHT